MHENKQEQEKALLISVDTGQQDAEELLTELEALAQSAGAQVVGSVLQKRDTPDGSTYIGTGRLEEVAEFCRNNEVNLLITDGELTPTQQRNIEKVTSVRTIDRTLLILDIFASRAYSGEGRIQVELARYRYMLPRLTGQGMQLSRQGGIGMRRGAGETQLETDRRHIRRRIRALSEQLHQIEHRRQRLRERRQKLGIPSVALVGYTNAGKSTLMNRLTEAGVLVEDKLFATLDPTSRALRLPDGRQVMLIDTVGLVRRLPHTLVEAFHATLEEAAQADVVLNVCDLSSGEADAQLEVTRRLLEQLGCADRPVIAVLNKCDRVTGERPTLSGPVVEISALEGLGVDRLLEAVQNALPPSMRRMRLLLPFSEGALAAEIRRDGVIHSERYTSDGIDIDCTVSLRQAGRLRDYILD